eukprot:TRINITY_DN2342_c0_g1_i5.p1 TRINITY_DN2342_c0_g1~~TRINITY_DN2342_c0_g1_i5.p1  ORF type:complete len:382 (-),score=98.98 TRINITY_DN2342_c0_g1_i5:96-1241(-)
MDEFTNVFFEAEAVLRSKLESCERLLRDYERQRTEIASRLDEVKKTEVMNKYGVMEGSTLTVTVMELELNQRVIADIYIEVALGENIGTTTICRNAYNRSWNETFVYDVEKDDIPLRFGLKQVAMQGEEDKEIDFVMVDVRKLRDQQKKEELLELYDGAGRLRVTLQWLHSRVQYLTELLRKWDDQVAEQKMHKDELWNDLETLFEPFPPLKISRRKTKLALTQKPQREQVEDINKKFENLQDGKDTSADAVWTQFSHRAMIAFALFAILVHTDRSNNLDLLICIFYVFVHELSKFSKKNVLFLQSLLGISLIMDIPYLVIYSSPYWKDTRIDQGMLRPIHRVEIILSWMLLFVKGFMVYVQQMVMNEQEALRVEADVFLF